MYPYTHPARLEALGRLFGLDPAPAEACRIVELGCGDGGNAIAIAQTLPQAQVLGVDLSPSAVERGRALAAAAGLRNVELLACDLADLGALGDLGPVDYLLAHGVYSWIPPTARGALLECCRRFLAPIGIAFVSYNAYPGSYLRDMARDILEFHLQGVSAPGERVERAHELMASIIAVEDPSPYASVLREHLQRMLNAPDVLLVHDDLAAVSTPFYFHEFIEHAAAHGLQFLCEAELADSQMRDVPESVGELIASLPDDVMVREQYFDFFSNRMFRQTLLIRTEVSLQRTVEDRHLEGMVLASPLTRTEEGFVSPAGTVMRTSGPLVAAAMDELSGRWPEWLSFAELAERARRQIDAEPLAPESWEGLRRVMLEAFLARMVLIQGCPTPPVAEATVRPLASPLARAQCREGRTVLSTLVPSNHSLEKESERRLLTLLDGTRDRSELAGELGESPTVVEAALSQLARDGLLLR
ncbi:MAG: class I SAM-dependent methyltransferase [Actinomycetota bacterium]|nr:class I SAM-dependent methyltransferase [Actinomycetota bacterium]